MDGKTFNQVADEMVASNRAIENLVKAGRVKLEAKRQVDEQRALAMKEAVEKRRAEMMKNFFEGLVELIGQDATSLMALGYEDVCQTPAEMRIFVSGHPVVFNVYHLATGESVRFGSEEPFTVAGLLTIEPSIDEDEAFEGCADWTFGTVGVGLPVQRFADLEIALALADERGKLAEELRARHAEQLTALMIQSGNAKMKAIYEMGAVKGNAFQDKELVYEPMDEPGLNPLVNMNEVTRLVRGIVLEVFEELEERGL